MKNFVQHGEALDLVAPRAVNAGDGALIGSIFGIAADDLANGATGPFVVEGVFDITALSTDVANQGALAYWDNTNFQVTVTATGNTKIGVFSQAKLSGDLTARVRLNESF